MARVASLHVGTFPYRRLTSRLISVPAERWELKEAEGCIIGKVLGTGRKRSTRLGFDPKRWAIFAVWEDEAARARFVDSSTVLQRWTDTATSVDTYFLQPLAARGRWGGVEPFPDLIAPEDAPGSQAAGPYAVLTRAAVRWNHFFRFLRAVPRVDDALQAQPGCTDAMGIGEWPVGQQATFSVWDSPDAIIRFAYEGSAHSDVIKRTYKEGWYSEELFCRFRVTKQGG